MANVKLFEHKQIRSQWDAEQEKWFFSIVDVIAVLTDSPNPNNYWKVLKHRLKKEGNQSVTNCNQLKMESSDGKFYLTDVADVEQLFRLIQSIPSPKAEPFKQWLAKTGYERVEASQGPEKSIDRAMEDYLKLGYSKEWVNQRLKSIEVRKDLTDEWESRGVKKGQEFAILTDIITKAWSGKTIKQYKQHNGLKKENLRDNMTNLELVLNMLAEATTTEISKEKKQKNINENKIIAKQGGTIAGNARKQIEAKTGKKIVSSLNAKKLLTNKPKKNNLWKYTTMQQFVGKYKTTNEISIERSGNKLFRVNPNGQKIELKPESATKFFYTDGSDRQLEFEMDANKKFIKTWVINYGVKVPLNKL